MTPDWLTCILRLLSFVLAYPLIAYPVLAWPRGTPVPFTTSILFVFDSSASMWGRLDEEVKTKIAENAVAGVLRTLPPDASYGLMAFGHRYKRQCDDIELLVPIGPNTADSIVNSAHSLRPKGTTPLAASLRAAANAFTGIRGAKMIVLITDGTEECDGDPCAVATELARAGLIVQAHTIGLRPPRKGREQLECIAQQTSGRYFEVGDKPSLYEALSQITTDAIASSPHSVPVHPSHASEGSGTQLVNLLSPSEGGRIASAGFTRWDGSVSGDEHASIWTFPGQEVVFAFKGNGPATFSTFDLAIPAAGPQNVREFELLISNGGPFQSLGQFTVANERTDRTYQTFTFAPVTARYVKLRVLSNYGYEMHGWGNTQVFQMRLMGVSVHR